MKPNLLVRGMHGLGDSIHQRAIMRLLMQTHSVTLETSWVSVYHDLIPDGLKVVRKLSGLRTQAKNAAREAHLFSPTPPAHHVGGNVLRVVYNTERARHTKSKTVLETMLDSVGLQGRYEDADYSLPIKPEWFAAIDKRIAEWAPTKPIMVYRPLTYRPEWPGAAIRAANPQHYDDIYRVIRPEYFVVSVADLVPGQEDILGPEAEVDAKLNHGELAFEEMAALFARADLVYTAGGFAAILAPAVGTAQISVGGGYEPPSWMESAARFAPFLSIPTLNPCMCASSGCRKNCPKTIDIPRARVAVAEFLGRLGVEIGKPPRCKGPTIDVREFVANLDVSASVETATPTETCPKSVYTNRTVPNDENWESRPRTDFDKTFSAETVVMETYFPKLNLPTVSLLCVETRMHEQARLAIADCVAKVKFADIVIHTDKPELIPIPGARYVSVPNWAVKTQAGLYCYTDAPASINTAHMIFLEWDGAIRDVNMWDPAFLEYDYIGAPWPGAKGGQWVPPVGFTVGNGGFTLWSQRLTTAIAECRNRFQIYTDVHVSKDFNPNLVREYGLKWAPEDMAYRFSFEHGTPHQQAQPSFGTHDIFNWPLSLDREDVIARTRLLLNDPYIRKTPKLGQLVSRAPWIVGAIPELAGVRPHPTRIPITQPIARRPHWPAPPPGPQPNRGALHPTEQRLAYERELQRRGLKA